MRDQSRIDDILNEVSDQIDKGGSRFPGMSYEDGVDAALRWVTGDMDDHPYPEQ